MPRIGSAAPLDEGCVAVQTVCRIWLACDNCLCIAVQPSSGVRFPMCNFVGSMCVLCHCHCSAVCIAPVSMLLCTAAAPGAESGHAGIAGATGTRTCYFRLDVGDTLCRQASQHCTAAWPIGQGCGQQGPGQLPGGVI
jgi:hypothetical protein